MTPGERYERASEIAEHAEDMLLLLGSSAEKANALVNVAHLHLRLAESVPPTPPQD